MEESYVKLTGFLFAFPGVGFTSLECCFKIVGLADILKKSRRVRLVEVVVV